MHSFSSHRRRFCVDIPNLGSSAVCYNVYVPFGMYRVIVS